MMYSPISTIVRQRSLLKELSSLLRTCNRNSSSHPHRKIIEIYSSVYKSYSCLRMLHCSSRSEQKSVMPHKSEVVQEDESKAIDKRVIGDQTPKVKEEVKSILPDYDRDRHGLQPLTMENRARQIFEDVANSRGMTKETFLYAVSVFISKQTLYRQGATEFIYVGLREMKKWGLLKDLGAYKALIQVFPEGKMVPWNRFQVEFYHFPKQQFCAIDLQEQMERQGVIPDDEFGMLLKKRFGHEAHCVRKYKRMMYWLPKFKHMNPYPIPFDLPESREELAVVALRRMCVVDQQTEYTVWRSTEEEFESDEDTYIASAQSPVQQELLKNHKPEEPLFVEGPYPVMLRENKMEYFMLRAEPNVNDLMRKKQLDKENDDDENLCDWKNFFEEEEESALRPLLTVHEQEDCTILGLTITGTSCKSSLVGWIRLLQRSNPNLGNTPVIFKIRSPQLHQDVIGDNRAWKHLESKDAKPKTLAG